MKRLSQLRKAADAARDDLQTRAAQNELLSKIFRRNDSGAKILWGLLHIRIIKCVGLRNADRLGSIFTIAKGRLDKSDPYVEAFIGEGCSDENSIRRAPHHLQRGAALVLPRVGRHAHGGDAPLAEMARHGSGGAAPGHQDKHHAPRVGGVLGERDDDPHDAR